MVDEIAALTHDGPAVLPARRDHHFDGLFTDFLQPSLFVPEQFRGVALAGRGQLPVLDDSLQGADRILGRSFRRIIGEATDGSGVAVRSGSIHPDEVRVAIAVDRSGDHAGSVTRGFPF
jgi:hypothetical protein